jgi:hypothetical protein
MKNLIFLMFVLVSLIGCSSLELEAVSSSQEETQRILALGLSHEENLIEAKKLGSDHMIAVVTLQLVNARDDKIQYQKDLIESEKIAEAVIVSADGHSFTGPEVLNTISDILNTSLVSQNYFLEGLKNSNNGVIDHKIQVAYSYSAKKSRGYSSVNLCDEYGRCETLMQAINVSSVNFSNCSSINCDYTELFELEISDKFLRDSIKTGIRMNLISKNNTDKLDLSVAYLMGYLKVVK